MKTLANKSNCAAVSGTIGIAPGARISEAVILVGAALAEAGLDAPSHEARALIRAALSMTGAELLLADQRILKKQDAQRISAFVARRSAREPLSRIVGEREFYGRKFSLSPATLDPRADSETVIEAVMELIADAGWEQRALRVLDVGTGSGALLLTLLAELPNASGVGTDISDDALRVASDNAKRLGVTERARFINHSMLDGLAHAEGTFDVLVSNPPYIASAEINGLQPEVRLHDPIVALDGGADGLDALRAIASGLRRAIPKGIAVIEFGFGQKASCKQILEGEGFEMLRFWVDLEGHTRCVAVVSQ